MRLTKRIRKWFAEKFGLKSKKKHFFDESATGGYTPFIPMGSRDKQIYGSKIAGDSKALVRGGFESGDKKRKKT